jgi:hypothetical protein
MIEIKLVANDKWLIEIICRWLAEHDRDELIELDMIGSKYVSCASCCGYGKLNVSIIFKVCSMLKI